MVHVCQKCGRALKPGATKYRLKVELVSMFDGYIEEEDEMPEEHFENLVRSLSRKDPGELMKDVAQTISLVICRACRNNLVKEWDVENKRIVH